MRKKKNWKKIKLNLRKNKGLLWGHAFQGTLKHRSIQCRFKKVHISKIRNFNPLNTMLWMYFKQDYEIEYELLILFDHGADKQLNTPDHRRPRDSVSVLLTASHNLNEASIFNISTSSELLESLFYSIYFIPVV